MVRVCQCVEEARAYPGEVIALYEDEFTFYQTPTIAKGYEKKGKLQPLARLGRKGEDKCRIVGTLDVVSGAVVFDHGSKIGVDELVDFCAKIRDKYITARKIYLIRDNWPIHDHPDVLLAASNASIEMVPIPTYAPWTNPIEKLWRWLYQDILHLHRYANLWQELKSLVFNFLSRFEDGSQDLLRYTGLWADKIPAAPKDWRTYPIERNDPFFHEERKSVIAGKIIPV